MSFVNISLNCSTEKILLGAKDASVDLYLLQFLSKVHISTVYHAHMHTPNITFLFRQEHYTTLSVVKPKVKWSNRIDLIDGFIDQYAIDLRNEIW